ncbi:MAG: YggT family protein [bacterium]
MDFIVFVINFVFSLYFILLAFRVLIPWLPNRELYKPIVVVTEPLLVIIRKGLPHFEVGIDVSPFVLIILLWLVQKVILLLLI